MNAVSARETVGRLVAANPSRSRVFERWGLDYCCGGKKPLDAACQERGLDIAAILRDLEASDAASSPQSEPDWTTVPCGELADHIVQTHHAYLSEALPRLTALIEKVRMAHGDRHPQLHELARVFAPFREELEWHAAKEENVLFPLIKKLETAESLPQFHCGSVNNPIRVMEMEHDHAGDALETMRRLTGDFAPPPGACNTFRAMLDGLSELEADMHQHVHKENNILFPRAAELEARLTARG